MWFSWYLCMHVLLTVWAWNQGFIFWYQITSSNCMNVNVLRQTVRKWSRNVAFRYYLAVVPYDWTLYCNCNGVIISMVYGGSTSISRTAELVHVFALKPLNIQLLTFSISIDRAFSFWLQHQSPAPSFFIHAYDSSFLIFFILIPGLIICQITHIHTASLN